MDGTGGEAIAPVGTLLFSLLLGWQLGNIIRRFRPRRDPAWQLASGVARSTTMCRCCAGVGPLYVGGDGIARCIDCDTKEARRAAFCGESWPVREIPKTMAVRHLPPPDPEFMDWAAR